MRHTAHVVAAGRPRSAGRLDWPGGDEVPDPSPAAVAAAVAAAGLPAWLGGGEPTLRRDLPAVVAAAAAHGPVGVDTDGLALARPGVARGLARLGVSRLRVALHCGRPDAHDWLVGAEGAARRVRKAITLAADAGVPVTVRCTVTRPTMDWLEETTHLVARLGASAVEFHRVVCRGPAARSFVTLAPRLGLLEPLLHAAVSAAEDHRLAVRVVGFPRCVAPRAADAAFGTEAWVVPDGLGELAAHLAAPAPLPGCPTCPGRPACDGAPADYVGRFGRDEIDSERAGAPSRPVADPPVFGRTPAVPPPRRGRAPATRLRFVRRQSSFPDLGGDPLAGEPLGPAAAVVVSDFSGTSRQVRQRLGRLAQEGATTLRLEGAGVFGHPDAASLLRDALRLSMPRVEARGDVRPLVRLSDRAIVGLRGLARLDAVLPPGADPADTDDLLARITRLAGVATARLEVPAGGWEDAPSEEP